MDHELIAPGLTKVCKQDQLAAFRRNPLQAYLHTLTILNHNILQLTRSHRQEGKNRARLIQLYRDVIVYDAIIRFGRSTIRQGIIDIENRPKVGHLLHLNKFTLEQFDRDF